MSIRRPHRGGALRRHALALYGAVSLLGAVGPVQAADAEPRVVVLQENIPQFDEAASGVTAAMRGAGLRPRVRAVMLDRKRPSYEQAVAEVRRHDPAVVVSIGTTATRLSRREFPEIPVVFAMVLNPVRSGILPTGNVTGAAIDIPFALQFRKFKDVVPGATRLGVLSDPDETGTLIAEAKQIAHKQGLTLVVETVTATDQVPAAFARLVDRGIDGFWSVADRTVLTPATIRIILQESLRARLPTMGLSAPHCKAGFLFALAVDYNANGRQAGELVTQVVRGTKPEDIPVVLPEEVQLVLNLRIAKHIGHTFAPGVIDSAAHVFE